MKSDSMSLQPPTLMSVPQQLTLSTPVPLPTPTEVPSAAPTPSSNEHIEHLISFFDEQPEDVTPKPVSSDVISYLTKKFTKENDNFNQDEYRKRCRQAEFPYPKSLPKKVTAQQAKNLIYNLAVKLEEVKNLTKRYLYAPIFSYKSENIITSLFHSKSLVNKHPNLPKVYH